MHQCIDYEHCYSLHLACACGSQDKAHHLHNGDSTLENTLLQAPCIQGSLISSDVFSKPAPQDQDSEVQVLRADLEVAQARYRALQEKCRQLESAQAQSLGTSMVQPREVLPPVDKTLPDGHAGAHAGSQLTPHSGTLTPGPSTAHCLAACHSADPFGQASLRHWEHNPAFEATLARLQSTNQLSPTMHRRGSWPQDMSTALTDQVLSAAQEVVELTANSLSMANKQEEVVSELAEARRTASTCQQRLEEREATVSDLTEHFLQVWFCGSGCIYFSVKTHRLWFQTTVSFVSIYTRLRSILS